MEKRTIDVAKALARLSELTIFELRGEWRQLHRMPPPMRLSRDLLTRGISYKLQERAYGGLSTANARKLERASAGPLSHGAVIPAPPTSLRPGTRLVREWRAVWRLILCARFLRAVSRSSSRRRELLRLSKDLSHDWSEQRHVLDFAA